MAACFELWLVSEANCCGHDCTGFHPLLQGYLCCRLWPCSFHFTLPTKAGGWRVGQFTSAMEVSCREGRIVHCTERELLQLSLGKTCLAAWLSSQWVAGLSEHITSCQEMIMYRVSVLALLKEGKLLFGKCQTPLAKQSNCPENSTGFKMHLSVHDLQRDSLAQL